MNRICRLWKYGCHASKLPISKPLHGNGLPLTTTSDIIGLTIIDLHRKDIQHGDCANSHGLPVVTHSPLFRALDFCRQQPADRRINTWHRRGVAASHSVETETNRRRQLPYHPLRVQIYVIVFSTSTRVMEKNCFLIYLTLVFKNGTLAYTFQLLNASSLPVLDIYIYIYIYIYKMAS